MWKSMASECVVEIVPVEFVAEEIVEEPRRTMDISAVLQDHRVRLGKWNLLVKIYNNLLFCLLMSRYQK
jgi:hypothetical protein